MKKRITDMPKSERPRERLLAKGPGALSDTELMAVLLGKGTKGHDVLSVAEKIIGAIDPCGAALNMEALRKIEGVGPAKAALIAAALEFSRRRIRPEGTKISTPCDVLPLLLHYADRKQEYFICISLNGANEIIAHRVVSVGLVNKTQVHPREVYADPITDRAAAIIVAHNHPSGSLTPSREDRTITEQLKAAGDTLGISFLDHIIFGRKGYWSFLEHKEL